MTDSAPKIVSPAYYTGLFNTRVTRYPTAGGNVERVLTADPMRVFVRFEYYAPFVVVGIVLPGPWPSGWIPTQGINMPLEQKFHDAPSLVQGEWYLYTNAMAEIIITECLYVIG